MFDRNNGDLLDAFELAFPDTGFVFDGDGEIVRAFAGPEVDLIVGAEPGTLVGSSVQEAFTAETAARLSAQIDRTLETGELQTREYIIEVETGSHSFDARMAPVVTHGEGDLVAAIFRDVTTRDLYAKRLDENNRILETIWKSTTAVSRATTVEDLHESICSIITDSTPYQSAWVGAFDEETGELVPTTAVGEVSAYVEQLPLTPGDETRPGLVPPSLDAATSGATTIVSNVHLVSQVTGWRSAAIRDGIHSIGAFPVIRDGEVDCVVTVYAERPHAFGFNERHLFEELCRDIADTMDALETKARIREQREQIEAQNVEWEVLNRIVRHDIKNKMAVILAHAEMLEEGVRDGQVDHVRKILDSGNQVVDITKEARQVAESMADSDTVELDAIGLGTILETEIEGLRQVYPEATVTVTSALPSVTVRANEFLASVFRNLFTNAIIHHDGEVPTVEVDVAVKGETVSVEITDDGPGLPEHVRESTFGGGQHVGTGADHGIGLFLVRSLVDQYGGSIRATNADSTGTTVSVELQRA